MSFREILRFDEVIGIERWNVILQLSVKMALSKESLRRANILDARECAAVLIKNLST